MRLLETVRLLDNALIGLDNTLIINSALTRDNEMSLRISALIRNSAFIR